jgi:hypothetical protein
MTEPSVDILCAGCGTTNRVPVDELYYPCKATDCCWWSFARPGITTQSIPKLNLRPPEPTGEPVNGHDFDGGKGECSACGRKGYARCMAMGCGKGGEA